MTGRQRLVDGLRAVPKGMRGDAGMTRQCINVSSVYYSS